MCNLDVRSAFILYVGEKPYESDETYEIWKIEYGSTALVEIIFQWSEENSVKCMLPCCQRFYCT